MDVTKKNRLSHVTTTFEVVTKKSCIFGVQKFNSKLESVPTCLCPSVGLVTTAFPLERVYVSMPSGGTGNVSISHLLGSVCTGDTPKSPAQISSTDAVSQTLSAAARQRAFRKRKLSFTTADAAMFSSSF